MADERLVEMIMSGGGVDADLQGADFYLANLKGANFALANLRSADLQGADLEGAYLENTILTGANLKGANLKGANLALANLKSAYLQGAGFRGANLTGANLYGANLYAAILADADFTDANLYGASFRFTNLKSANLKGAYFEDANLQGANLSGADLRGADFTGANFKDADLTAVKYDSKTKWPRGFTPPGGGRMASLASATAVPAIGDILVSSWGYDQTNVNFYEVVGISGSMITIQEIGKRIVSDDNRGSQKVMPVPGRYTGKPMRKKHSPAFTGKYGVKIHSYAEAYLWNGKPEYQTAAGFGR